MLQRLLLIGNSAEFHVGAHFRRAAESLDLATEMFDNQEAFAGPAPLVKFNWWLRGHRPTRLRHFGRRIVTACREHAPDWVLTTGVVAPLSHRVLTEIGSRGVRRLSFLTDDPWNRAHLAPWFMEALTKYDCVFSTRRANLDDLRHHGCRRVEYLPFAYAPEVHFVARPSAEEAPRYNCDVLFAGGADPDRLPWVKALIRAGLQVALYGGYWDRESETRPFHRGHADLPTLRKAIAGAKTVLGLVRRANRDGHAMRSFEVPAMGGCMLTEETDEHRELLGPEGECTVYFRDEAEMLRKARWLLENESERRRLAEAAHTRITGGRNTYADRLKTMLEAVSGS
jgi:spore maturation protein CgeB